MLPHQFWDLGLAKAVGIPRFGILELQSLMEMHRVFDIFVP